MTSPDSTEPTTQEPVDQAAIDQATLDAKTRSTGTIYGLAAYGLWGLFPLYLNLLRPSGAIEVLAHRVLWSLVLCLGILAVMGRLRWMGALVRRPKVLLAVSTAGLLIACNWTIYTFAVLADRVTEASLGYFLNPLVTVALGVILLRETLRPAQWVAVGIGAIAAIYLTFDFGSPPWVSLSLALSFASYGLVKKKVGSSLSALQSLTAETIVLAPAAAIALAVLAQQGNLTFGSYGPVHALLLAGAGIATTVPLLLFAGAARRVPLTTIGLLQFITPVLQLMTAVLLLGETMETSRWIGFGMVWIALVILSADSLLSVGRSRRLGRAARGMST